MYIIPKKYDAAKIRLEIKKQMAAEGKESVLVPELGSLYDVALDKSGLGRVKGLGKVIMREDFFCLLDQIDELPKKFKKNNRNYKSAIFALLNEMAFDKEDLGSYSFRTTVEDAGLTKKHCDIIYKTVRERGFLFRAEVYQKAIEEIDKNGIPAGEEYILVPGEYYTHLEQKLLEKLGAEPVRTENRNQALWDAMLSDSDADFQIPNPEKKVGFLKADSVMEQYIAVKNHILALMTDDLSLSLNDFCVVVGTGDSLSLCTSYYEAVGFHPLSSASVQTETPLLEGLTLISYALSGELVKLILYYNRHHPKDKVIFDPSYEFEVLWKFCDKLKNGDGSRYDNYRKLPAEFKEWILKLDGLQNDKKSQSVQKHFDHIQKLLATLGLDDNTLYEYKSSPEQIFKGRNIPLADMIEYLKNILSGRRRNLISTWDDGVVLVKTGEYVPDCRFIYFVDLEEKTFLKDKMPNLLLSADEHDSFNKEVYGMTKEEHLREWFGYAVSSAQRTVFVIPRYDEGTVISEYVENVLRLFPPQERTVTVTGGEVEDFKHKFYRTFDDVKYENEEPVMAEVSDIRRFIPAVKKGDPLDFVLDHLGSATRIEAFMKCPARFVFDNQQIPVQIEDKIHFTRGNAFHLFCETFFAKHTVKAFKMANPALVQDIAAYLSGLPCGSELADYLDTMDVKGIFEDVKAKYSELELKDTDLLTYTSFVCRLMKEYMADCDSSTIRIEVFFGGMPVLERPDVHVSEGYIDMMFRTITGRVILMDFKSGEIGEYADDVRNFSNVQLLIYSHMVKNALESRDFSVFQPTPEQYDSMKEKGKDDSSILEPGYFETVPEDAKVEAYYVSYKGQDGFKAVNGIAGADDPFAEFQERLTKRLELATENIFFPTNNKDCRFCPLNAFCPDRESSLGLDMLYEELDLQPPFLNNYPVPSPEPEQDNSDDNLVRIIQFAKGDKRKAVSDTTHDIIISAGAGAGKTEVLTTRYLNLLLNTEAKLENILCITFTEKAAGEMKKRIFAKLQDTISLGAFYSVPPAPGKDYRLTEKQLDKLKDVRRNFFRKNRISTFHSFCLNMLTKYEKEDPASQRDLVSTVAEDFMIRAKKIAVVTSLIKKYSLTDMAFKTWVQYQSLYVQTEENEFGAALDILNVLDSIKLSGMPLSMGSYDFFIAQFKERKDKAVAEIKRRYNEAKKALLDALEAYKSAETRDSNIAKLNAEIASVMVGECKKDSVYPYSKCEELKELRKVFCSMPKAEGEESCPEEMELKIRAQLFGLMLEADRQIEEYKIEKSIIELSDYHLNLISLMKNSKILNRIKKELFYIMVDEFQDTNWLQKKILDLLHDEENHVFFVGDLKQSIYRFQQCDNQIFKQYRDQEDNRMEYITFQENFRSVKQIVDFNNEYFSRNLVDEYKIIPHTSKDKNRIEYGIPVKPAASGPAITCVELMYPQGVITNLAKKEKNALLREQEAFFIAHTIADTGKENYGKWGILVREYTNIGYILDALQRLDIPYSFCIKKDFFRQPEIVQVLQVLQVLYGFLPPETLSADPLLYEFVTKYDEKKRGFCYAVSSIMELPPYAVVRPMLCELLLQCQEFVRQLGESPEEILTQLLGVAEENSKEININALENGVRIMTVHSSKGLEFDYLFVSKITDFTGRGGFGGPKPGIEFINYVDEKQNQLIDFDITGVKKLIKDDTPMLYASWMKDKNTLFDNEEKGNLLYVAFTRAKKHLIITLECGEAKKDDLKPDVNWLKNIRANVPYMAGICNNMEIDIQQIEPVLLKDKPAPEYAVEKVGLPDPALATISVSKYLDILEEEFNPDDKITDADADVPETTGTKATLVGTAVHSFFEKNIHDLDGSRPEEFPVSESMKSQFLTYVKAGLAVPEYRALVAGADKLMTEAAMIFHTTDDKLLNGVIDLIVRKGNTVTVLDYKTHSGSVLDIETLDRYKMQVALYAHGLESLFPGCRFECCLLVMYSTGNSELVKC